VRFSNGFEDSTFGQCASLMGFAFVLAAAGRLPARAQAPTGLILPGAAEIAGLFGARFSSTPFLTFQHRASVQIGSFLLRKGTPATVTRSIAGGETQQIPASCHRSSAFF
jgi:hypothetical protein